VIYFVPYAYDRMPSGNPRDGVPPERLGSRARIECLVDILNRIKGGLGEPERSDFRFILTAGYSKCSPNSPSGGVTECLAEQMAEYLFKHHQLIVSTPGPLVWGTYAETRQAIVLISRSAAFRYLESEVIVFVSTNSAHMPRVRLCWYFLKPRGWQVKFVTANHAFTRKEWLQETVKFFNYLYRFIFNKW
jgi:hypothetical protein